jgi:hypothetical protein
MIKGYREGRGTRLTAWAPKGKEPRPNTNKRKATQRKAKPNQTPQTHTRDARQALTTSAEGRARQTHRGPASGTRRNVRARLTQGRVAPAKGNAKLPKRPRDEGGPREARPASLQSLVNQVPEQRQGRGPKAPEGHDIDLHRETDEKARQPEAKVSAIARTRHTARLCNAKRSRTRHPKPTHGARDRPKQSQPRAGQDRASESGQRFALQRTRPTDTGTRCPGKG